MAAAEPKAVAPAVEKPERKRRTFPVTEHQVLLSSHQTAAMVGRSVSSFYDLLALDAARPDGPQFPRPVRVTPNAVLQWIRSEVLAWIHALPRAEPPVTAAALHEARNVWGNVVHPSATGRQK